MRFQDKVAVITGGASGVGAATARLFVAEGARVVIADLNEKLGAAVVDELGADRAMFMLCDVGDFEQVAAMIAGAHERFGRLDILFNNAGIGCFGETPDLDPDVWAKVMAVDLNAVFYTCRAAIPLMRAAGGGVIVNMASISGLAADWGFTAYNAAKAAVINYTRSLALDHARDNIRANALCPGMIDTPLTSQVKKMAGVLDAWLAALPMGRAGTPEEVAKAAAFLASDDASFITGTCLVVDGGQTASTGQPNLARFMKR